MSSKLSQEVINQKFSDLLLRNIKCLDEYKGARKKHNFSCLVQECNHNWSTTYDNVVNKGSGCPKCSGRVVDAAILNKWCSDLLERDIICVDDYKGLTKKSRFKCLNQECGRIWISTYESVVKRGSNCPYCSGHFLPNDLINKKLADLTERKIRCLSGYLGTHKNHEFLCLVKGCNHTWVTNYNNVVNKGSGCPRCVGKVLTPEEKIISGVRVLVRNRISASLRQSEKPSFSSFHNDELINYCQVEYLSLLPRPKNMTLDHILPLNIFDPTDNLEMKLCWNRRNLRWVTGVENSSKNNKIIFDLFDDWHYLVYNLVSSGDYDTELAKSLLD